MRARLARWVAWLVLLAAGCLFLYPAVVCSLVLLDPAVRQTGQTRLVVPWFKATARRYDRWATRFLEGQRAARLNPEHVAATEWPMFGSVFLLLTAEQLQQEGRLDARTGDLRQAVDRAREVVVSPDTAAWVRAKWGDSYLDRENVFYRMLLIMGLTAYARITGDPSDYTRLHDQWTGLARELMAAPYHVLDDYPGECYPSDVLWAVAALQRAAALEGTHVNDLAAALMQALDGPLRAAEGLPAFQVDAPTGYRLQGARGSGNSGILLFAPDLDKGMAAAWYAAYVSNFWSSTGGLTGFTEMPRNQPASVVDVDSGPVIRGLGSVASAFGIGAARRAGDLDRAAALTWQAVACSWPTPAGFLIPGLMGQLAIRAGPLGELALLFAMTRPLPSGEIPAATRHAPGIVWGLLAFYTATGIWFIFRELSYLGRRRPK